MGRILRDARLCATLLALGGLGCAPTLDLDSIVYRAECDHSLPPPPPVLNPSTEQRSFTAVVKTVDLGERPDKDGHPGYRTIGFDLDNRCTGLGEPSSCIRPEHPIREEVDGVDGIDNTTGRVGFERYQQSVAEEGEGKVASVSDIVDQSAKSGFVGTMLVVHGYNGTANDTAVQVGVLAVTTFPEHSRLGLPADDERALSLRELEEYAPGWEGSDEWYAFPEMVEEGEGSHEPKYRDDWAYVSSGTLVVNLDSFLTGFAPMSQTVFTAKIVPRDGKYFLEDGMADGRIHLNDFVAAMDRYSDPDQAYAAPLCRNSASYEELKDAICRGGDINYASDDDGSAPCDAVSQAWRFWAEPARLAGVTISERKEPCEEGNRPSEDRCP